MPDPVIVAAPLLIAAIVMAVRFAGCRFDPSGMGAAADYGGTVLNTPGLVSLWRLNDPSGPTAVDSKDGHNGTYQNQSAFEFQVPGLVSSAASDPGNTAARFDGNSAYVSVGFDANLNPAMFTVEALVQPSATGTFVVVSSGTGYRLVLNGQAFEASVAAGGAFNPPVVVNPNANGPYYVAMTYDGTTLSLYVNPDASDGFMTFVNTENTGNKAYNSATVSYQPATGNELRIGAGADGAPADFFAGAIQDVAVYDRVLTFAEIENHYWIFATGYSVSFGGPTVAGLAGVGGLSATNVGFPPNGPTTTTFGAGTNTYAIPWWCNAIDLILLGAGGGGSYGSPGNGGNNGLWTPKTLNRGADIPWAATSITVTVGSGGTPGTFLPPAAPNNGGNTTATWAGKIGMPLTALGGAGGGDPSPTGLGPGNTTFSGVTYTGGADQTALGAAGNAPGGGGAAGTGIVIQGGAGADGAAYVVARQS